MAWRGSRIEVAEVTLTTEAPLGDVPDARRERIQRTLLEPGTLLAARFGARTDEARQTWPGVYIELEPFARHVAGMIKTEQDLECGLDGLEVGDLYLACGCTLGVPAAVSAFDARHVAPLRTFVKEIDTSPARLDELRQMLRERLLTPSAMGPPRIVHYSGRGPLSSWVKVAARRLAITSLRGRKHEALAADAALAGRLAGPDAELGALRGRYTEQFAAALRTALEQAPRRERLLLRLHLVDGMSLTRIAVAHGVSQSTVSRWLERARDDIRRRLQHELEQALRLDAAEMVSIARLVQSQLDISLATVLAANAR
jgi:RNA polymerase sigma-70 factor (ECF subfamily)